MFCNNRIDGVFEGVSFDVNARGRETDVSIFEAADPDSRGVEDLADRQIRSAAMATVLGWIEGKDFSFDALDALVVGMVDFDGDEDVGEDEEADYNDLLSMVADAMVRLGAKPENVKAFIDDEDAEAGDKLGKRLTDKLDGVSLEDDELVTRYAMRSGEAILEATVKTIRDGKVVLKKKRIKKVRLSAAQRAALKKARRKANTGAARLARKKSMRIRKQRGL